MRVLTISTRVSPCNTRKYKPHRLEKMMGGIGESVLVRPPGLDGVHPMARSRLGRHSLGYQPVDQLTWTMYPPEDCHSISVTHQLS